VSICVFLGTQNRTLCFFSKPWSGNTLHLRTTHYALWFRHALPTQQTAVYVRTGKEFLQHLFCTNTGANCHANFTAHCQGIHNCWDIRGWFSQVSLHGYSHNFNALSIIHMCSMSANSFWKRGPLHTKMSTKRSLHFHNTFRYCKKKQHCWQELLHSKSSLICHLLHTRGKWPNSFLMLLAQDTCAT